MHHVFLSHSSLDHDVTREFYDNLVELGFRVWFDEVAMKPGDSLIEKIGGALISQVLDVCHLLTGMEWENPGNKVYEEFM